MSFSSLSQATCRALMAMSSGDKIVRMEAEVRAACDLVQKASTELEYMRAREALKRRCAILNSRIESLQVSFIHFATLLLLI
jgi:hypothetical protein